jgi:hypothetical protein
MAAGHEECLMFMTLTDPLSVVLVFARMLVCGR